MKTINNISFDKMRWEEILDNIVIDNKIDCKKMVCMGSAFAHNIQRWLACLNDTEPNAQLVKLNNPFSICALFQRVYEPANWEENILEEIDVRTGETKYRDPLRIRYSTISKDELIESNEIFTLITRECFRNASGFFVSLDISEVCSLKSNPGFILSEPHPAVEYGRDVCTYRFASVDEVQLTVANLVRIIREHVSESCPVIFSLSPEPLRRTHLELSSEEVGGSSKTAIVSALQQIVADNDKVTYFPTNEIIQYLQNQGFPTWQKDKRHLTATAVDYVARNLWDSYDFDADLNSVALSKYYVDMVNKHSRKIGKLYIDDLFELNRWEWGEIPELKPVMEKFDCKKLVGMGSCFAINFLKWTADLNGTEVNLPWSVLYNPWAVFAEFKRVFEPENWEESILDEIDPRTNEKIYRDPMRLRDAAKSREEIIERNEKDTLEAKECFKNHSGFLITLGLSEVCSLKSDPDFILNEAHPDVRHGKDICNFKFASVDETQLSITKTVKIIRKYVSDSCPIIFSLSPVPLARTYSKLSVREANNLSKATLLVALQHAVKNEDNVTYFPSYEIIQALHEQGFPTWQEDGRHVTAAAADFVARQLWRLYDINTDMIAPPLQKFCVSLVDNRHKKIGFLYVDGSSELYDQSR